MIEEICSDQGDELQTFADEIIEKFECLDKGEFYDYLYKAVY